MSELSECEPNWTTAFVRSTWPRNCYFCNFCLYILLPFCNLCWSLTRVRLKFTPAWKTQKLISSGFLSKSCCPCQQMRTVYKRGHAHMAGSAASSVWTSFAIYNLHNLFEKQKPKFARCFEKDAWRAQKKINKNIKVITQWHMKALNSPVFLFFKKTYEKT